MTVTHIVDGIFLDFLPAAEVDIVKFNMCFGFCQSLPRNHSFKRRADTSLFPILIHNTSEQETPKSSAVAPVVKIIAP